MSVAASGDDDLYIEAGEYVIGTLDRAEREAFALRLRDDVAAQRAVEGWERRLAGLALDDEMTPPPDLWARIEHELRVLRKSPLPFRVVEGGKRPDTSAAVVADYRRSRDRWRVAAIAGGAVAAALIAFVAVRESGWHPTIGGQTSFVAAVNRGGDKPALIVRVDLQSGKVFVRPVAMETPAGHSLELWYVGDRDVPRSMGLVGSTPAVMTVPQGAHPGGNATFAVSVEPTGGSKTGAPTGPVVYSGQLVPD